MLFGGGNPDVRKKRRSKHLMVLRLTDKKKRNIDEQVANADVHVSMASANSYFGRPIYGHSKR
jgi:hypothetical protein